jgi:repressor LexA
MDNENQMAVWLKTLRAANGLKQSDLADRLGVSRSSVAAYESGQNPIPGDIVDKIRSLFVNIPTLPTNSSSQGSNHAGKSRTNLPKWVTEDSRTRYMIPRGKVELPRGPVVPGGPWVDLVEVVDTILVDEKFQGEGRFVRPMIGDSMLPLLEQGDELVWQTSPYAPLHRIVLAHNADQGVTVKQLKHDGINFVLHPLNPRYEDAYADQWEIVAYLVGVIGTRYGAEYTLYNEKGILP